MTRRMSELDPRKRTILRAVIVEYVQSAEPVGSEYLANNYGLGVRSATIRNELAEMADMGYLEQPHTSAGRVPSDLGYRYFVDELVLLREPGPEQRTQVQEAASDALQEMIRASLKALSRLTRMLAAASSVGDSSLRVRNAVVTALGPDRALLVVVLHTGQIINRLLECPPGLTLTDVGKANEALAQVAEGRAIRSLVRVKTPAGIGAPGVDRLTASAFQHLRAIARELSRGRVQLEGEEYLFAQPELQRDASTMSELVAALESEDTLYDAIALPEEVTIGRENPIESLRSFSVVRRRYFVGEDDAGTIALIGPRRMDYEKAIPLLDFASRTISETLTKLLR
jgi:heat-inducible transcriptional repressor